VVQNENRTEPRGGRNFSAVFASSITIPIVRRRRQWYPRVPLQYPRGTARYSNNEALNWQRVCGHVVCVAQVVCVVVLCGCVCTSGVGTSVGSLAAAQKPSRVSAGDMRSALNKKAGMVVQFPVPVTMARRHASSWTCS